MNSEMIDWIEYNIERDPESVNLMLSRLEYNEDGLTEPVDIILYCYKYKHLLTNYSKTLMDCSKVTLKWVQKQTR